MTRTSFLLTTSLVLVSLLAITSADYGYEPSPKPVDTDKPINSEMLKSNPLSIGVQGTIFCKSGPNYTPIQGAVTRVTCLAMDENGYEMPPFSVLGYPSDEMGYFFATLFPSHIGKELTVTECKAFLESSPLEKCKVPTDVNRGISGALLSGYRLLEDKKMKLFSVGPFFYTADDAEPINNGY